MRRVTSMLSVCASVMVYMTDRSIFYTSPLLASQQSPDNTDRTLLTEYCVSVFVLIKYYKQPASTAMQWCLTTYSNNSAASQQLKQTCWSYSAQNTGNGMNSQNTCNTCLMSFKNAACNTHNMYINTTNKTLQNCLHCICSLACTTCHWSWDSCVNSEKLCKLNLTAEIFS